MKHILLVAFAIFIYVSGLSVNDKPVIVRACLNFNDSIVTISWKPVTDNCGSFTRYSLYGQIENDPFTLIDHIPDRSITEYPFKLDDLNADRSFYISVDFACDNSTILTSDTISIDLVQPQGIPIDSVSIDLITQQTLVGWKPNAAPDSWFYTLYDYSSGDGDSLTSTSDTSNVISNTQIGRYPIVLATTDSCGLLSIISTPHQTALLRATLDKCGRSITLNWNRYEGWASIDSQHVYISKDHGPFIRDTTHLGSSNSSIHTSIDLGPNYRYYIRSFTGSQPISSSSNIVEIQTTAIQIPDFLYLNLATVYHVPNDPNAIPSISWTIPEATSDLKRFDVYRGNTAENLLLVNTIDAVTGQSEYNFDNFSQNATEREYFYQVIGLDECDSVLITSNLSSTIHLSIDPLIVHNEYINWYGDVRFYELIKLDASSTWNTIHTSTDPITLLNLNFLDSTGCYRIVATENPNQFSSVAISRSNILCLQKDLTFEITTALNPQSTNNRFIIVGEGIDKQRSYYKIYNRWGQEIANNPAHIPWYANHKGEIVENGIYIYTGEIFGLKGERQSINGTLHIVR